MNRFYKISIGARDKYYRTLKALIEENELDYDNVYYKIKQGLPWIDGEIVVSRKYFEESK